MNKEYGNLPETTLLNIVSSIGWAELAKPINRE